MKRITKTLICLILSLMTTLSVSGQSQASSDPALSRTKPDSWFTLSLPTNSKIQRFVDVDGGFYSNDQFDFSYSYWTFQNTPNFLRGKYGRPLRLACTGSAKGVLTLRRRIDGKKAVLQQCSISDERKGFRYLYYVTFPRLKVFDGEAFRPGTFSFTFEYQDPRYSSIAARIVNSLDFER